MKTKPWDLAIELNHQAVGREVWEEGVKKEKAETGSTVVEKSLTL